MMRRMPRSEFEAWKLVYERFDPFGEMRMDVRFGEMIAAVVNTLKAAHFKDPTFVKPSDFIHTPLDWYRPPGTLIPGEMSQEQIKATFKAMADAHKLSELQRINERLLGKKVK